MTLQKSLLDSLSPKEKDRAKRQMDNLINSTMSLRTAKIQAQNELRRKVLDYCKKHKITPSYIEQNPKENPFKKAIGSRALYQLACGKNISSKQIEKLEDWFGEFEKLKTD